MKRLLPQVPSRERCEGLAACLKAHLNMPMRWPAHGHDLVNLLASQRLLSAAARVEVV